MSKQVLSQKTTAILCNNPVIWSVAEVKGRKPCIGITFIWAKVSDVAYSMFFFPSKKGPLSLTAKSEYTY